MKKKIVLIIGALIMGSILTGCSNTGTRDVYGIVLKSDENAYNECVAEGFEEVIHASGGECIIKYPESATVEDQIIAINELIEREVVSISIAANDMNALESVLQEAMEKGIKVSAVDASVNAACRMVFVNQSEAKVVGQTLMEAVYDISGGAGQWAILSATSQAVNQNEWIEAMQVAAMEEPYQELLLVDIVYGNDEYEMSRKRTKELLEKYPDLEVICAPTANGLQAAAEVIREEGSDVKLTGLGLPSEMESYIGETDICPYMFLWDPMKLGQLTAYTSMALVDDEISGQTGDVFQAGELGEYRVTPDAYGGTEIVLGEPLRFDQENIAMWKERF